MYRVLGSSITYLRLTKSFENRLKPTQNVSYSHLHNIHVDVKFISRRPLNNTEWVNINVAMYIKHI